MKTTNNSAKKLNTFFCNCPIQKPMRILIEEFKFNIISQNKPGYFSRTEKIENLGAILTRLYGIIL